MSAAAASDTTVTIGRESSSTATLTTDFTLSSTTITITAGQTTGTATLTAVQDAMDEVNETAIIEITGVSGGGGATESGTQQSTVTITDDDAAPSLSIADVSQAEGNSGTSSMTFTVSLSAASGQAVTVDYATSNGTATSGVDYAAAGSTLTFAAGETSKTFNVTIAGDTAVESNETFTVTLSNPTNATISDTTAIGTITNDENTAPTLTNLNTNSVNWAGVGNTVLLDADANAVPADSELGALNSSNGNWSGASLTVQRSGTAIYSDVLSFNTAGANFTVSGSNLQSGGLTFATFSNSNGLLTITFTSSGTAATTALVQDVVRHVTYRNDTPAGDATVRFTLSDGSLSTTADVTVASDTIYITNTTDTANIDISDGVSFSEAVAIAAADDTGTQTLVLASTLAGETVFMFSSTSLGESLALDADAASGATLSDGNLTLGSGITLSISNGAGDTLSFEGVLAGDGGITKTGAGTLTLNNSANTYTGATQISAGTLATAGGGGIGNSSAVTVDSGATLSLSASDTIGSLAGAGTVSLGANTLTAGDNNTITSFSGVIEGTGGLTKDGSGTMTLTGANTFTGTLTVNAGGVTLNHASGTALADTAAVTLAGGTLTLSSAAETIGTLSGASGTLALGANALTVTQASSGPLSAAITGTAASSLTKTGGSTLTLSSTSNSTGWAGGLSVTAGTVSVSADSNLTSGTVSLNGGTLNLNGFGGGSTDNAIALGSSGGTISVTGTAAILSGTITGTGALTKTGGPLLTLSGTNDYSGGTRIGGSNGISIASAANIGTGAITLNTYGTGLTITGSGVEITNAIAASNNATITNANAVTLSGVISGTEALTKAGVGTLTLSGNNTFSGSTTVSAGTLLVGHANALGTTAGGTTISATGGLELANGITLAETLTLDGGRLRVGSGVTGTVSGGITLTNDSYVNAEDSTATLTLSGVISDGASSFGLMSDTSGTVVLSGSNTYNGTTTVAAGTLSIATDANLGSGDVSMGAGTSLAITGTTDIDNAVTSTGSGSFDIQVATGANATFSGVISGDSALNKTGAGTLALSGSNTYTGTTTVAAGTLVAANDTALGTTAAGTTVANGATLAISGGVSIAEYISLDSNTGSAYLTNISGDNTLTGTITHFSQGGARVSAAAGTTLTISGIFAGGGPGDGSSYDLHIGDGNNTNTGTVVLSGVNTFKDAVTLHPGTLVLAHNSALGATSKGIAEFDGGTLALQGGVTITGENIVDLFGGNIRNISGDNTFTGEIQNPLAAVNVDVASATTLTLSGTVGTAASVTKTGSGTLVLSGTNGYVGETVINGGTVSVTGDGNLGGGAVTLNGGTLTVTGSTTIDNGIVLGSNGGTVSNSAAVTLSGEISGSGSLTKTGSSALTLSGDNTYTGATTLNSGVLTVTHSNALGTSAGGTTVANGTTLRLGNGITIADALTLSGTGVNAGFGALKVNEGTGSATVTGNITLAANTDIGAYNAGDTLTLSGNISGGFALSKVGSGTVVLSGANTYTGTTTVSTGTLRIADDANLGSGSVSMGADTVLVITEDITIDNAIALTGNVTMRLSGRNAVLSGEISGSGNLSTMSAGSLALTHANTYTGTTTVNESNILIISAADNISRGTLSLQGNGTLKSTGSNVTLDNAIALNGTANIHVDNALTLTGNQTETGSSVVFKQGSGTLSLSGAWSIAWPMFISAGTLEVSGTLQSAYFVSAEAGATLGGTGSINGAVTVQSGGILAAGTSPGTLTLNNGLTVAAGGIVSAEIGGTTAGSTYDQLVVNGSVNVTGATLDIDLGSYTPVVGDSYILIDNDGTDAITGTVSLWGSNRAEGARFTISGKSYHISYVGGSGNDLVLSVYNPAPVVTGVDGGAVVPGTAFSLDANTPVISISDTDSADFADGHLLIQQTSGTENGDFILNASANPGVRIVYGSDVFDANVTAGALLAGANIYFYDGSNGILIGTVDAMQDGQNGHDLKINLTANSTPAHVTVLAQHIQYKAASLGSRNFELTVADGDGEISSPAPFTLTATGDGFTFADATVAYTENGNATTLAGTATLAHAVKDALNDNAGNYNGTVLQASALSEFDAEAMAIILEAAQAGEMSVMLSLLPLAMSEATSHVLELDTTGKSFFFDDQTNAIYIMVADQRYDVATVAWGASNLAKIMYLSGDNESNSFDGNGLVSGLMTKSALRITFTSNLATTALVNEILQSVTYRNNRDVLQAQASVTWTLKENNVRLMTGESMVALTGVNDAPEVQAGLTTLSYSRLIDFADQTYLSTAGQSGVYSSSNTLVYGNIPESSADYANINPWLSFLDSEAGMLAGNLSSVDSSLTQGYSEINFTTPQTELTLKFFSIVDILKQYSIEELNTFPSTKMLLYGLPNREITYYNAAGDLLGTDRVTDVEANSLSFFVSSLANDYSNLTGWNSLYASRFTAPAGETVSRVRIASVDTILSRMLPGGTQLPVLLDSVIFDEVTAPNFAIPPLVAGQVTEMVVGDMLEMGSISDADTFMLSSTPEAIAIAAVDNTQGLWEYRIGNGTWMTFDFTGSNAGKAVLLDATDSLRFTPDQNFNGVLVTVHSPP